MEWPAHVETLRAMARDGASTAEIARRFDTSAQAVRCAARRYGVGELIRPVGAILNWPDHVGTLRAMAGGGASAAEIGAKIGCTRSAAISAAHRYGIPLLLESGGGTKGRRRPRAERRSARKMPPFVGQPGKKHAPVTAAAPPQPCSLTELNDRSCRWPHGDPHGPGFFFCGSPEADFNGGRPYCRVHHAIACAPYPRGGA